jgi:hypothetical protein
LLHIFWKKSQRQSFIKEF